jgi:hypothetical protein
MFSCGWLINKLLCWYQAETGSCASVGIAALYPKDDIYQAKKFLNSWVQYVVNLRFIILLWA